MGSNPGEGMDVCKCAVPLRHGGTLNSPQAVSSLVWLVEAEERSKRNVSSLKESGNDQAFACASTNYADLNPR
ncbi:hypothetical protein TNCV_3970821 [Trichonephila clavipes]|nr:hypothetical protein TNCV_3970821 [Trichonephila clavipes]